MNPSVRYPKDLRERAKRKKKFLITLSVDGRQIGDDSCIVQRIADLKLAKKMFRLAIKLLSGAKNGCGV